MKQDPYNKVIIVDLTVAEIVAILACVQGDRRTTKASERRALRTAVKRLSSRAIKSVGPVR